MEEKICSSCGAKNSGENAFCAKCGANLTEQLRNSEITPVQKKKTGIIIAAVVIIALGTGAFAAGRLSSRSDDKEEGNDEIVSEKTVSEGIVGDWETLSISRDTPMYKMHCTPDGNVIFTVTDKEVTLNGTWAPAEENLHDPLAADDTDVAGAYIFEMEALDTCIVFLHDTADDEEDIESLWFYLDDLSNYNKTDHLPTFFFRPSDD